ncbi:MULTISPECIES: IclR family transcriptional regulator [Arsenicicoccus]|uniref:IclR family transcriptional regulator n=1 Tax=Arsenicicoccus TaxID=267408 RepID=UPI00257A07F7|nr:MULTISPECIES: IclR family transcriptional regulator C-terminal domain-containing protein [Arsenicicoccus]
MSTSYGQSLSSLDAGLRAMTLFTTHDVLTVTLVARELGCSRATSYRILNTLRNRDIVMLGPGGRGYYPGPALVELSRPRGLDQADRARLRPVIEEAVSLTAETVHVAALIGTQVLFFDGQEPDRAVRASLRPGYLRLAHAISAGKLLLAQFTDEQVLRLYPDERLGRVTPWTVISRGQLMADIRTIREQGYATNQQQTEVGLGGVSIPLPGRSWRERVALCATIPIDRATPADLERVRQGLQHAARRLR